jgi:hypothetical protein
VRLAAWDGFRRVWGRMGVDQILMTRRTADGRSELPAVRHL